LSYATLPTTTSGQSFHGIIKISKTGKLFTAWGEDYFITNSNYPWKDCPEVVVGRVAYDNWLVLNANKRRHTTIDATRTLHLEGYCFMTSIYIYFKIGMPTAVLDGNRTCQPFSLTLAIRLVSSEKNIGFTVPPKDNQFRFLQTKTGEE
jgi:hypothetical protein